MQVAVMLNGRAPIAELEAAGLVVERHLPRLEVIYGRVADAATMEDLNDIDGVWLVTRDRRL